MTDHGTPFKPLWDSIHALPRTDGEDVSGDTWADNPWVVALNFEVADNV